jgi:hypothetical protein
MQRIYKVVKENDKHHVRGLIIISFFFLFNVIIIIIFYFKVFYYNFELF